MGPPPYDAFDWLRIFYRYSQPSSIHEHSLTHSHFTAVPCTIYPSVAYVVPEERMGVAFGITIAFTNAGLVVSPIIFGYLVDYSGYVAAIIAVIIFELVGLGVALLLWWWDTPKLLDMPSQEAGHYAHEEQERRRKAQQKEEYIELISRSA